SSCFCRPRNFTARLTPEIAVPEPHHALSHHQNRPENLDKLTKLQTYHAGLLSYYLAKLKATPDGDGSLLDHLTLLYGSGMSDSNVHDIHGLPIVLIGGGAGRLQGGRHLRDGAGPPLTQLYLNVTQQHRV